MASTSQSNQSYQPSRSSEPGSSTPPARPRPRRRRRLGPALVARVERVLLGMLMSLAATVVERRLQRAFTRRTSGAGAKEVGQQAEHDRQPEGSQHGGDPGRHPG